MNPLKKYNDFLDNEGINSPLLKLLMTLFIIAIIAGCLILLALYAMFFSFYPKTTVGITLPIVGLYLYFRKHSKV